MSNDQITSPSGAFASDKRVPSSRAYRRTFTDTNGTGLVSCRRYPSCFAIAPYCNSGMPPEADARRSDARKSAGRSRNASSVASLSRDVRRAGIACAALAPGAPRAVDGPATTRTRPPARGGVSARERASRSPRFFASARFLRSDARADGRGSSAVAVGRADACVAREYAPPALGSSDFGSTACILAGCMTAGYRLYDAICHTRLRSLPSAIDRCRQGESASGRTGTTRRKLRLLNAAAWRSAVVSGAAKCEECKFCWGPFRKGSVMACE